MIKNKTVRTTKIDNKAGRLSNRRGAALLALCLCLLLAGGLLPGCSMGGDDSTGVSSGIEDASGEAPAEAAEIEGIPVGTWQGSALISERDSKAHAVEVRVTGVDTDSEEVQKQIDAYNVSASGHTIPALDDPQYAYYIAHYEVYFPEDYPDGDYGITQVAPAFSITAADGGNVIVYGNVNYSGLTETFEIGYQPKGYDFHAGDTYEGAIVYVMAAGCSSYRILETAPRADGTEAQHYYMPE